NALKSLKNEGVVITDAFVIIDRMEGAEKAMKSEGVKMHNLVNILEITNSLHEQKLISDSVLNNVKNQINEI
ncbi:MAG TPA: orotate phosphoribosyltransferase, partial [Nitrosarchaeum sp.]|nr:orotate phosphoribosyltransferase [Nitrosarchaeum sp.]